MIYANYDDGAGGTNQVSVFDEPDGDGFPWTTTAAPPSIYTQVASFLVGWGGGGDYSMIRNPPLYMFMLTDPVTLDPTKDLLGLTLAVPPTAWASKTAMILAATGTQFVPNGTVILVR